MKFTRHHRKFLFVTGTLFVLAVFLTGVASYLFIKPYFLRSKAYDLRNLDDFNVTTFFMTARASKSAVFLWKTGPC